MCGRSSQLRAMMRTLRTALRKTYHCFQRVNRSFPILGALVQTARIRVKIDCQGAQFNKLLICQ